MFRKLALGVFAFAVAAFLLIPAGMLVMLLLARPSLAAAAQVYRAAPACSGPAEHGLPSPKRPIPVSMRDSAQCAVTGAIVAEKEALSQGFGPARYTLALRSDGGVDYRATLEDDAAAGVWTAVQTGDRVLLQTFRGRAALVGNGAHTVRTASNPLLAVESNRLGVIIAGGIVGLEILAIGLFAAWRKRAAASV
jgi:hypothetical protein